MDEWKDKNRFLTCRRINMTIACFMFVIIVINILVVAFGNPENQPNPYWMSQFCSIFILEINPIVSIVILSKESWLSYYLKRNVVSIRWCLKLLKVISKGPFTNVCKTFIFNQSTLVGLKYLITLNHPQLKNCCSMWFKLRHSHIQEYHSNHRYGKIHSPKVCILLFWSSQN